MLGMLAVSALSTGLNLYTQNKASKAQEKANIRNQERLDAKSSSDNAWYRMQYYRDPLRSPSFANMLETIRGYNDRMIQRQKNMSVINGGTHEQQIAAQENAMNGYAKAVSGMKANDDARRDKMGELWQGNKDSIYNAQSNLDANVDAQRNKAYLQTMENINNFASGVIQTATDRLSKKPASAVGNNVAKPLVENVDRQIGVYQANAISGIRQKSTSNINPITKTRTT